VNTTKIFAIEFFIAIGINSWGAIKQGYAPWPPTIIASCIAMAILSLSSAIDEKLAVLLGAGFLAASVMAVAQTQAGSGSQTANGAAQKWTNTFGAVPPSTQYDVLQVGSGTNQGGTNAQGQQGQGQPVSS
jgi:hypothetical protein